MSEATYLGQKEPQSVDQAVESLQWESCGLPRAKLYAALVRAQAELEGAKKAAKNDHFRSKYARLEDVIEAIRPVFAKHGLGYVQECGYDSVSSGSYAVVTTIIVHESGEEMSSTLRLPVTKNDAQGVGSALTYARRYGLLGMAGIAPEDDDGEAAVGRPAATARAVPDGFYATLTGALAAIAGEDIDAMKSAYADLKAFNGKIDSEYLLSVLKPLGYRITQLKAQMIVNGKEDKK